MTTYNFKKMETLSTPIVHAVAPSTGTIYTWYYSLTSCNDPLGSASSRQSMTWDQLTDEFHELYKVWSGTFNIKILPNANDTDINLIVVCYLSISTTACTTIDQALGQPGATWTYIRPNENTNHSGGKAGLLARQFRTLNYLDRNDMEFTSYDANPTENVYANFAVARTDSAAMANATFSVVGKLHQRVQFRRAYDPAPIS